MAYVKRNGKYDNNNRGSQNQNSSNSSKKQKIEKKEQNILQDDYKQDDYTSDVSYSYNEKLSKFDYVLIMLSKFKFVLVIVISIIVGKLYIDYTNQSYFTLDMINSPKYTEQNGNISGLSGNIPVVFDAENGLKFRYLLMKTEKYEIFDNTSTYDNGTMLAKSIMKEYHPIKGSIDKDLFVYLSARYFYGYFNENLFIQMNEDIIKEEVELEEVELEEELIEETIEETEVEGQLNTESNTNYPGEKRSKRENLTREEQIEKYGVELTPYE